MTALRKRFEMFSLSSVMQPAFYLPYVKFITVPAACLVHNLRHERKVTMVLVMEKRLNETFSLLARFCFVLQISN